MIQIRPVALSIIEALKLEDNVLNSDLGSKDGEVYKRLYNSAKNLNPINKNKVFPGITKYLRPRL